MSSEFIDQVLRRDGTPSRPSTGQSVALPDSRTAPEAARWAGTIFNHQQIKGYMLAPKETCVQTAKEVQALLDRANVQSTVRALLCWKQVADTFPTNHVAVLVNLDGEQFAIDPSAGQFPGAKPAFIPVGQWEKMIKGALPTTAVVYRDFKHVSAAVREAGPLYSGNVNSFEGGTILVEPTWFKRVRDNPEAMAALEGRVAQARQRPLRR